MRKFAVATQFIFFLLTCLLCSLFVNPKAYATDEQINFSSVNGGSLYNTTSVPTNDFRITISRLYSDSCYALRIYDEGNSLWTGDDDTSAPYALQSKSPFFSFSNITDAKCSTNKLDFLSFLSSSQGQGMSKNSNTGHIDFNLHLNNGKYSFYLYRCGAGSSDSLVNKNGHMVCSSSSLDNSTYIEDDGSGNGAVIVGSGVPKIPSENATIGLAKSSVNINDWEPLKLTNPFHLSTIQYINNGVVNVPTTYSYSFKVTIEDCNYTHNGSYGSSPPFDSPNTFGGPSWQIQVTPQKTTPITKAAKCSVYSGDQNTVRNLQCSFSPNPYQYSQSTLLTLSAEFQVTDSFTGNGGPYQLGAGKSACFVFYHNSLRFGQETFSIANSKAQKNEPLKVSVTPNGNEQPNPVSIVPGKTKLTVDISGSKVLGGDRYQVYLEQADGSNGGNPQKLEDKNPNYQFTPQHNGDASYAFTLPAEPNSGGSPFYNSVTTYVHVYDMADSSTDSYATITLNRSSVSDNLSNTITGPPPQYPVCAGQPCAEYSNGRCIAYKTALGIINTDPVSFVGSLAGWVFSLIGGIAMLLIIIAGYRIMWANGDPEKMKGGREVLIAAITGLIFTISSYVIYQTITADLLHLPGFGGNPVAGGASSPQPTAAPINCSDWNSNPDPDHAYSNASASTAPNGPAPTTASSNTCANAGGSCGPAQLCRSPHQSLGQLDCSSGKVCCK